VLKTLVAYRLIDPGSEWRLHRQWYEQSAMGDLLGADFALAHKDNLYRCLDRLVVHKTALFSFLQQRWKTLFGAEFEVLLYDLTSTYFECDPPAAGKRRFGYSRDKRSDCVQVVIALIVTPDGLPLAYEVMAGNTSDPRVKPVGMQDDAARLHRPDRGAVWQGAAHLGDGPRRPDRGGVGRDADGRAAGALPGGHAARPARPTGAGLPDQILDRGTRQRSGEARATGQRTLCPGAQWRAPRQGLPL
jgi:hypothetical protein